MLGEDEVFHTNLTPFKLTVRTGQAHRTLHGHTGPVTCLQFDETHIISGSLDKSIRVSEILVMMVKLFKFDLLTQD